MNTLEFLQRVLPSEGTYCAGVAFQDEGGYRQRFFSSVADLAEAVSAASERDNDVYYAVASFKDEKRKQDNVHQIKLLAIDIDVGKPNNSYPDRKDAVNALADFIERSKLPSPLVVSSGKGFHVYWVLTRTMSREEWQPLADGLKACWQSYGLIGDPAVTADAARILRPVGTQHMSSGKTVKVMLDAPDVSPEQMSDLLAAYMRPTHTLRAPGFGRTSTLLDDLAVKQEFPPAVAFVVSSKCRQISKAIENPKDVSEPFWYSLLGVAAYTTDPEATALLWSKGHPDFNQQDTIDKLNQWKANATGPATCASFEQHNPSGCNKCPFKGRVNTPAALGRAYTEAPVDVSAPDPVAQVIPLPRPFKRTDSGIKITIEDTDVDVCPFDIYPVGYGRDEVLGYETVRFHWNRLHTGWTLLSFRQALLTDGHRDFATVMADHGIVLPNARQTEFFRMMLRTYMDELKRRRAMLNLYASMGWKENNTCFVLGDTVIRKDENGNVVEEVTALSSHATKNSPDLWACGGDLNSWISGTQVLEIADMPWHMFALNTGFAAPLFAFTGLKGLTLSLYGPTGGGKTLIQYWVQSIYGDPDRLHFAAKFTQNTLFSRLALYANLPMTIDEATMFQDKDVGDFLYWVSQGRDKARLNRNSEERDAKTWSTPVLVSTNVSLQSKLVNSGLETDAQMARLLELTIPPHKMFKKDSQAGQKIYSHLMENYGHAGRVYLKELVRLGEDGLRTLIDEARKDFHKKYGAKFTGEERYWETAIILQDLGAAIAQRLGLIKYDYRKATQWVLEQLGAIRAVAEDSRADTYDLISEYLNEVSDCAVLVVHTGTQKPLVDTNRMPRGEIRVRFDVYRAKPTDPFNRGVMSLDKAHFRKWLSMRGGDFKSLMKDIEMAGIDATPRSGRLALGKDTGNIKVGMTYVVGIDMTHPRFASMLNDAEEVLDRATVSTLQVVGGKSTT